MFYKIVSNGTIVDASSGLSYVRWQEKNGLWLTCGEEDAQGIINSNGEDIYLLSGTEPMEGYSFATVTEITEEEYLVLREELDAGGEIVDPDEPDQDPDTPTKTRLRQLEEQVAALQEVNDMLTECLLEMSEIVYG